MRLILSCNSLIFPNAFDVLQCPSVDCEETHKQVITRKYNFPICNVVEDRIIRAVTGQFSFAPSGQNTNGALNWTPLPF